MRRDRCAETDAVIFFFPTLFFNQNMIEISIEISKIKYIKYIVQNPFAIEGSRHGRPRPHICTPTTLERWHWPHDFEFYVGRSTPVERSHAGRATCAALSLLFEVILSARKHRGRSLTPDNPSDRCWSRTYTCESPLGSRPCGHIANSQDYRSSPHLHTSESPMGILACGRIAENSGRLCLPQAHK